MRVLVSLSLILFLAGGLSSFPFQAVALTVSPVRIEASGDPGTKFEGAMMLINEEQETKAFYSSFANFDASGESGAPQFVSGSDGLAAWITTIPQVTLTPGEQKEVPYTINVPANAKPGGYFAAIFWGTQAPIVEGGGEVAIGGKLGVLVLFRVAGEIAEGGGLLEFGIADQKKTHSSLPITFVYRFSNDGGDRVKPTGEVKITNIFGGTTAVLDANRRDGNVLPGSIRKFEIVWATKGQEKLAVVSEEQARIRESLGFFGIAKYQWKNFAFGRYTAHLDLTYGSDKQANANYSFFIFPWQLLSIISALFIVVGLGGRTGLRKYNRWVIAKATAQQGGKRTKNKKNE